MMKASAALQLAILGSMILLSACGFSPIYGAHDNSLMVSDAMNHVAISNIPDRPGQMLRNALIDRMYGKGRPSEATYRLNITLRQTETDLGIQADSTSTRSLLTMYGDYQLVDLKGTVLLKGSARSIASFNKLTQQYSTETARESAVERTIVEVSNQIVNNISLYFAEKATNTPAHIPATSNVR